jgi:hypothetical protein
LILTPVLLISGPKTAEGPSALLTAESHKGNGRVGELTQAAAKIRARAMGEGYHGDIEYLQNKMIGEAHAGRRPPNVVLVHEAKEQLFRMESPCRCV